MRRLPKVWAGWGVLPPEGVFLEAISERSLHIGGILDQRPKGSRLVRVTAELEPATRTLRVRKRNRR